MYRCRTPEWWQVLGPVGRRRFSLGRPPTGPVPSWAGQKPGVGRDTPTEDPRLTTRLLSFSTRNRLHQRGLYENLELLTATPRGAPGPRGGGPARRRPAIQATPLAPSEGSTTKQRNRVSRLQGSLDLCHERRCRQSPRHRRRAPKQFRTPLCPTGVTDSPTVVVTLGPHPNSDHGSLGCMWQERAPSLSDGASRFLAGRHKRRPRRAPPYGGRVGPYPVGSRRERGRTTAVSNSFWQLLAWLSTLKTDTDTAVASVP